MEEMLNKNQEELIVELINQIELLAINRKYLDELEASLNYQQKDKEIQESSLYRHRRNISRLIYQLLMNIHLDSPLFKEIVDKMVPPNEKPAFMKKVSFYHKQIQLLPTG